MWHLNVSAYKTNVISALSFNLHENTRFGITFNIIKAILLFVIIIILYKNKFVNKNSNLQCYIIEYPVITRLTEHKKRI